MRKKAIISAKEFSQALEQAGAVLRKSPIPVLSEALVRVSGGVCTVTATNLDTWLIRKIPADGDDFAFVFQRTKDVAKACRLFDGELTLELNDTGEGRDRTLTLYLRCGNRTGEFKAMAPEDYPKEGAFETEASFTANAAALLKRVERVGYAADRPTLGANVSISSIQFSGNRVFALNGGRLACDTDKALLFPRAFMAHVEPFSCLKLFGDKEVSIELGESRGRITDGSTTVIFQITGKETFDVDRAIPKEHLELLTVSPQTFLRELNYLKEFTAKERQPHVSFNKGRLFMPLSSGKYRAYVEIDGENNVTFAFDLRYMLDAIQQFKNEPYVRLRITSAVTPFIIEADGRNDLALICPVKLSDKLLAA